MAKKSQDRNILILGLVVLALVVVNSLVYFFRADLTESGAYTISDTSKKMFAQISEPVRVTYYLSGKLKNQVPEIQRISDLLYEYARLSNGTIQARIIDTDGKEDELHLEDQGIQPQSMQIVDKNQMTRAMVYSGLIINYLNQQKVLPWVQDPTNLEYDLTSNIKSLLNKRTRVLGVLAGGDGQTPQDQYTILPQVFSQIAEVRTLQPGDVIPPDIDVLFVLRESKLSETDAYHVDQFIMSGKGVLVALDGVGIDLNANGIQPVPQRPGAISRLIDSYGVTLEPGWVLDDSSLSFPMQQQRGQVVIQQSVPYQEWLAVPSQNMNQSNPLSARSPGLVMLWTSPVSLKPGVSGEVLASSSPKSWVMNANFLADPNQVYLLHRQQLSGGTQPLKAEDLAVLRENGIDSYYKGKDLKTLIPGTTLSNPVLHTDKGRVLVLGNANFASDLYSRLVDNGWIPDTQHENFLFLQNAFEWLSNDAELMQLRTREVSDTTLSKIQDPGVKDTLGAVAMVINVVVVPLILVVIGIVRTINRRRLRNAEVQQ